jgi:uncharacterized protein (TIGR02186 family)
MKAAACLAAILLALASAATNAEETPRQETVQSDISTREISIKPSFTGIEILIFGSIDFSKTPAPETGIYDVIIVIKGPSQPEIVRRKQRVAGIWVNGASRTFPSVPEFYAVLSSRPFRAIAPDETLRKLGIGLTSFDFGRNPKFDPEEEAYRSALIRLKQEQLLFQEHDDSVDFIGRSLFRATVALPVNVPVGRYTADVYLFRSGELLSKSQSTLEVNKVGFERLLYLLAFKYPFLYGLVAVLLAVLAGLAGWIVFRRD